jgi:hypothetical protein
MRQLHRCQQAIELLAASRDSESHLIDGFFIGTPIPYTEMWTTSPKGKIMGNESSLVVWCTQTDEKVLFDEMKVPGGIDQAVIHARELVSSKPVIMGQILASDGKVLATFTGDAKDEMLFAH